MRGVSNVLFNPNHFPTGSLPSFYSTPKKLSASINCVPKPEKTPIEFPKISAKSKPRKSEAKSPSSPNRSPSSSSKKVSVNCCSRMAGRPSTYVSKSAASKSKKLLAHHKARPSVPMTVKNSSLKAELRD